MQRRSLLKLAGALPVLASAQKGGTEVSIRGNQFFINGKPTYAGRTYKGMKIEGLLMNVRAVQATFDDLNPATRSKWAYPDTGKWEPQRNVREFTAALPEWRRHGVLAFTINLQGGSPEGYSREQPWENSAIDPEGNLRPAYMERFARILERAEQLGMVAIVGYFYFVLDALSATPPIGCSTPVTRMCSSKSTMRLTCARMITISSSRSAFMS